MRQELFILQQTARCRDENSQVYTSPIPLKDGGYEIKALFVNHYGIASDVSSADYYIDISRPDAPYVTRFPETTINPYGLRMMYRWLQRLLYNG